MKKIPINKMVMALFLVANLHAISYEELLELAIQNNATLQVSKSKEEQVLLESKIETRLENPTLELELGNFARTKSFRRSNQGSRVGVSQSLMLPSVKRDKLSLGVAKAAVEKEYYGLERLDFSYKLSLHYLDYKEASKLEDLELEALKISQKIMNIAKERYEKGTGLKSDYLKAKIDHKELLNRKASLTFKQEHALNTLKLFTNLEELDKLDLEYTFAKSTISSTHPLLKFTEEKRALSEVKLQVASHSLESIELFSELEEEPDQNVFRVGIAIPLTVFNDKSEEKQLAKIDKANQNLALKQQTKALRMELKQIEEENRLLENMLTQYEALIEEQNILIDTYQKGYGIAKINLLELVMSEKSFITNKEKIIKTKLALERNIVKSNYLKGGNYE